MKSRTFPWLSATALAFGLVTTTHAANIDVGALAPDGTSQTFVGDLAAGELDFYTFSMPGDVNNGDGSFLNIQTFGEANFTLMDTEIGLYDSAGAFIVSDDDDNGDDPFTLLYSLLTFGDSDPLGTTVDSTAGEDGTLSAGAFTLVVGGFNTDFTADIGDVSGGNSAGDYNIQFTHASTVPEPSTLLLVGATLLGGLASARRRAR